MYQRLFVACLLVSLAGLSCGGKKKSSDEDSEERSKRDWAEKVELHGKNKDKDIAYEYGRVYYNTESGRFTFEFWASGDLRCDQLIESKEWIAFDTIPDAEGKMAAGAFGVKGDGENFDFRQEESALEITEADFSDRAKGVKGRLSVKRETIPGHLEGTFTIRVCPNYQGYLRTKDRYEPKPNKALARRDGELGGKVGNLPWQAKFAIAEKVLTKGINYLHFSDKPLECDRDESKKPEGTVVTVTDFAWGVGPKRSGKQQVTFKDLGKGFVEFEDGPIEKGGKLKGNIVGFEKEGRFEIGGNFTATICD